MLNTASVAISLRGTADCGEACRQRIDVVVRIADELRARSTAPSLRHA